VIVATRDRPEELRRALAGLAAQTHPAQLLEVVVVDDGSSSPVNRDDLHEAGPGPSVQVVRSGGVGPASARNAGAASAADCDLLLFTDDDAVAAPTWVAEMAKAHGEVPGAALGGPSVPLAPENPYSDAFRSIEDAARIAHARYGRPHLAAANLAIPTGRFAELGGFDPGYGVSEDRELCDRWLARGWPARFRETAVVSHSHPETLGEFWSTFVRYGRGAHMFHRDPGRRGRAGVGVRISGATVSQAIARSPSPRGLLLVGVWLAATVVGFTRGALAPVLRDRRRRQPTP
jgi:GT2 family glycosyltransferase